ncbi:hypothetical protein ACFOW1_06380 [Parasediminibacterium paludis]|uniref:Transposase n=1 Tax=Parasediminibacterium paludis TaxID=908966 RepID=A0ABV8PXV2_9BACT
MGKKNIEQFNVTDARKEKFVLLVVYQNNSPKYLVKKYGLSNSYLLANWVSIYQKALGKGTVTLPVIAYAIKKGRRSFETANQRALKVNRKAKLIIDRLNSMIYD